MADNLMVLVGGPCDGRRVQIDGRPKVYYVPRINRIDMSINPRDEMEARYIKDMAEEYIRRERGVYMHYSIDHMDVFDVLTQGYRSEIGK